MSDYRAVAALTRTLQNILQEAVADIQGAQVRTARPEKDAPEHRHGLINIFLYQVEHNPSWRNAELPVRRGDGSVIRRPQVALDLSYLLSFYGDEAEQIPQLLLGKAVSTLHASPYPSPRYLPRPARNDDGDDSLDLSGSGLGDQIHLLRFTPVTMGHDEMSKLWTIFFQVPYALSLPIRASVVLIEPDDVVPEPELPVRRYGLYEVSMEIPVIEQVVPQVVEAGSAGRLLLRGRNLGVSGNRVSVSGRNATILAETGGSLTVELPPDLPTGTHLVVVSRDVEIGDPPLPRRLYGSNPASFVLQPRLISVEYRASSGGASDPAAEDEGEAGASSGPVVAVDLQPAVTPGQRIALLLNEMDPAGPSPGHYTLPAAAGSPGEEVLFPARGIAAGRYLVRISVDGVASRLGVDSDPKSPSFDRYDRPTVEIP